MPIQRWTRKYLYINFHPACIKSHQEPLLEERTKAVPRTEACSRKSTPKHTHMPTLIQITPQETKLSRAGWPKGPTPRNPHNSRESHLINPKNTIRCRKGSTDKKFTLSANRANEAAERLEPPGGLVGPPPRPVVGDDTGSNPGSTSHFFAISQMTQNFSRPT